jgi:hypothetical protein
MSYKVISVNSMQIYYQNHTSQPAKQEVIIVMRLQDILHGSPELEKNTLIIFCLHIII